jgi:uncharacterized protein YbaR (Trm112 family)
MICPGCKKEMYKVSIKKNGMKQLLYHECSTCKYKIQNGVIKNANI